TYINSLLDNIESYQPFDIKSHSSEVIQSFTAFILKGEDLEKLKDFLIANNIPDFRISFGIWGATFGFASIPKTISNSFLTSDYVYLSSFFKDLTKQLFNYDLDTINEFHITKEPHNTYKQSDTVEMNIKSIEKPVVSTIPIIDQSQPLYKTDKILCPLCNSEMILIKGTYGEFYGCTQFRITGCKGTRQLKEEIKTTMVNDKLSSLIIEYVNKNGHCKTSDLLLYINENTKKGYNVGDIETFIKQNIIGELELKKKGRSSGVMKRDNGIFDSK
ncbi:MAG TPA: hypothetical protein VFC36_04415, partial [Paludibacter sp.]|nr:hypothetical protein [Paludibacter sp.]